MSVSGVPVYPESAYQAAFTVCLGVALVALIASLLVTEMRCRNVWADR